MPVPPQVNAGVLQVRPAQQGCPDPPQAWQVLAPPAAGGGAQTVPETVQSAAAQQS